MFAFPARSFYQNRKRLSLTGKASHRNRPALFARR
jgi:hypothetical protein